MPSEDKTYFQGRAEEEIELAQSADHPDAARSHYLLAAYYLDLVHNEHRRSDCEDETSDVPCR